MSTAKIEQSAHYVKDGFGIVLRSSGMFYYKQAAGFRTTVTFMNYWKAKRDLDVSVFASLRDMSGRLIRREEVTWERGHVVNYAPEPPHEPFEGSVEIEVFALKTMVIPFAAIIVVYDTDRSVALTHNYARTYAPHEIEEGRTITDGEESCWTVRDGEGVRSFAVMHNGLDPQPAQQAEFTVTRPDGTRRSVPVEIPELGPYASYRFEPQDHMPDLPDFLDGTAGNGALSFKLNKAFTRMLVGNERRGAGDIQITHSNFNYARHQTDAVRREGAAAWMMMPDGQIEGRRVRVYPDCDVGSYVMASPDGAQIPFDTGEIVERQTPPGPITFKKREGGLPTRLVTAIVGDTGPETLPFELSLGILHEDRPQKRMWWAPISCDEARDGEIIATRYEGLYGPYRDQPVNLRLYSEASHEVIETDLDAGQVRALEQGKPLEELVPGAREHFAGGLGWFTWYSEYGGFQVFTKLKRRGGSFALEHGF